MRSPLGLKVEHLQEISSSPIHSLLALQNEHDLSISISISIMDKLVTVLNYMYDSVSESAYNTKKSPLFHI